jgi:hypothetical protein
MIRDAGQDVLEVGTASFPWLVVGKKIDKSDYKGVVLIGGYDVLPSQRVDVLDPPLRAAIGLRVDEEPDNFIVWSDEIYGDADHDGLPELPVTRVPDGRSAPFLLRALQASLTRTSGRYGIRNVERPFADTVWQGVPGSRNLLTSKATRPANVKSDDLKQAWVYFMLHGDHHDGARFWGEDQGPVEAINVSRLPKDGVGVVLSGCCWGALTVDQIASTATATLAPKTVERSMALSLLAAGAPAFIGCTGAHYSPDSTAAYFGGPMHAAFWKELIGNHQPPAAALYAAKKAYLEDMPHGQRKPFEVGIERKIYKQFTCLGLGW